MTNIEAKYTEFISEQKKIEHNLKGFREEYDSFAETVLPLAQRFHAFLVNYGRKALNVDFIPAFSIVYEPILYWGYDLCAKGITDSNYWADGESCVLTLKRIELGEKKNWLPNYRECHGGGTKIHDGLTYTADFHEEYRGSITHFFTVPYTYLNDPAVWEEEALRHIEAG